MLVPTLESKKTFLESHFGPSKPRCWSQVCRCRRKRNWKKGGEGFGNPTLMGWNKIRTLGALLLLHETATKCNRLFFFSVVLIGDYVFFFVCFCCFIRKITQGIKILRTASLVQLTWSLILCLSLGHRMESFWFFSFSVQHKRPYWGKTLVSNRLWINQNEAWT